jgi:hypothetical protein
MGISSKITVTSNKSKFTIMAIFSGSCPEFYCTNKLDKKHRVRLKHLTLL